MSYDLYMNGTIFPVTPGKVQIKTSNGNKTVTLINNGEINMLKSPKLEEISFELLLPAVKYPFANNSDGFHRSDYYVDLLRELNESGQPFQFILSRNLPGGTNLYNTDLTVSIEDVTFTDTADEGFDTKANVKLKQYKAYGTKVFTLITTEETPLAADAGESREPSAEAPSGGTSYPVQKGDSLWKIAQSKYGNGALYTKILEANKDKISNPNLIYPGQELIIP